MCKTFLESISDMYNAVYHNTSILISERGEILGKYRKMHIPHDPRFFEKYYFTPGDAPAPGLSQSPTSPINHDEAGFHIHNAKHADIGLLICWDQWFPEAARITALRGEQDGLPYLLPWTHDSAGPGGHR